MRYGLENEDCSSAAGTHYFPEEMITRWGKMHKSKITPFSWQRFPTFHDCQSLAHCSAGTARMMTHCKKEISVEKESLFTGKIKFYADLCRLYSDMSSKTADCFLLKLSKFSQPRRCLCSVYTRQWKPNKTPTPTHKWAMTIRTHGRMGEWFTG
jgi:hypothetical protein